MDAAVVRFAEGEGEILLATNIVEAGLDVPRANTMLVWRPDRFGLVAAAPAARAGGRGRGAGVAYLLTDPEAKLPARDRPTAARHWRRSTGWAPASPSAPATWTCAAPATCWGTRKPGICGWSGSSSTGTCWTGRWRRRAARRRPRPSPALALGIDAFVPESHVPEVVLRVDLHARLGRLLRSGDVAGVEALEDELEDRFGEAPAPVRNLLALARLSARCRQLGVVRLEVGPAAAAATLRQAPEKAPLPLEHKGDRLLLRQESATDAERLAAAEALLAALRPGRRRRAA